MKIAEVLIDVSVDELLDGMDMAGMLRSAGSEAVEEFLREAGVVAGPVEDRRQEPAPTILTGQYFLWAQEAAS